MGCGLYLAWPAFYTDVTDAYRLDRRGRLRTDLGGVYFNVVVCLVTMALYAATGLEVLLLLVVIQHFEIAHQLLPVVRLDGYYIVADLTGVPDLFSRIGPILRSIVPWRQTDQRVVILKRWVRVAVTAWVLIVVPLLLFELLLVLVHLPRIIGTSWDSGQQLWDSATMSFRDGSVLSGIASILQVVVLVIPIAGIFLMLIKLGQRMAVGMWKRTDGRPVARSLAVLVSAAVLALLVSAWLPRDNYKPIGPDERGTLTEALSGVRTLWTRDPLVSDSGTAPAQDPPRTPGGGTNEPGGSSPPPAPETGGSPQVPVPPASVELPEVTIPPTLPPLPTVTTPPLPTTPPTTLPTSVPTDATLPAVTTTLPLN